MNRGGGRGGGRGGSNFGRSPAETDPEILFKVFLGGLSYDTTTEGLKSYFEKWGTIKDCVVMKDKQTGRSRGFGFITYTDMQMVDDCQAHRPHNLDGRNIETKRARPRDATDDPKEKTQKMFVGGLKNDTTEDQMRETFGSLGKINEINLIRDKNTQAVKGFAFVTFDDHDTVDKCVLLQNFKVNDKEVEVKKAVSKEQKMQQQQQGGGRMGGGGWQGYGNEYSQGGGYGGNQGGAGYGNQGYGSQGYGGGNQGYGGGYDSYSSGYGGNQGGGWNQNSFGQNYNNSYGGGAMRGSGYNQRGHGGPYGGYQKR